MAYQSLYRRYRPQRFSELRGQEHLVAALQNAVREDRVGHAYLFSGPRGTGKTSSARILAKVLNCENPIDGEPCGVCESCVSVEQGTSFDVHELDAASNNGVDAIRELIAKAAMGTPGRTKVYILDEVHMLSTPASNALLKTLEEPPPHVVFVLATTDPQKVLPTIRSRTQHLSVRLLSSEELAGLAEFIIADAQLDVPPGTVDYVVRAGAGSARDMESALDQVVAAGALPDDTEALDELVEALCESDTGRALIAVDAAISAGRGPRVLGELLIGRLRDVFLASMKADLSRLPDRDQARITDQAARLGPAGATRALEVLGEAFVGIQDAPDQRIPLEVALVRLTRPEADTSLAALADRVSRLERGAPAGVAPAAPAAATRLPRPRGAAHPGHAERCCGPGAAPRRRGRARRATGRAGRSAFGRRPRGAPGQEEGAVGRRWAGRSDSSSGSRRRPRPRRPPWPVPRLRRRPLLLPPAGPARAPTGPDRGRAGAQPGPRRRRRRPGGCGRRRRRTTRACPPVTSSPWPGATRSWRRSRPGPRRSTRPAASSRCPARPPCSACPTPRTCSAARAAGPTSRPPWPGTSADRCRCAWRSTTTRRLPRRRAEGRPRARIPSVPLPVPEDHEIDPSELVDATDVAATSVDRVKELFPGAELVDPRDPASREPAAVTRHRPNLPLEPSPQEHP